jgi:PAS domain S-box-containing protein
LDNNLNIFLSEIIDQSINGIIITDPKKQDNPIIYANQSFYKMFGYTQDEVLGKNCRFLQTHKREQKSIDEIRVALKEQKPITTIVLNHKKNGELIQCELSISPIFDKNAVLQYFLGIQKDVTREVELANKMTTSQKLANIGSWEYDIINNNLYWSDQIYKIFEVDKDVFEPSYEYFLSIIHPDDKRKVDKAYLNSLKTKKSYSIQHRLLMKDGME